MESNPSCGATKGHYTMSVARMKGAKGKCDVLFSKIIRNVGYCQRCGSTANLQCAHIISRRYSNTRCDIRNAWPLCAACHFYLTNWPREHSHFITETIGSEVYDELKARAEALEKVDWEAKLLELKEIAKNLGVTP